jgi:hypothetical protein
MNKPNLLLWGNNVFIQIDSIGTRITTDIKYKHASISGYLLNDNSYTYKEVMAHTDNKAVACTTFADCLKKYNL